MSEAEEILSNELLKSTFKSLRQDIAEVRRLALAQAEMMRRLERNQTELKDDLETMFRTEVLGMRTAMEASLDRRFDELIDLFKAKA